MLNYSAASVVCAVCKDWDKVLGVFEEMAEKKIPPNAACLTDLVVVSIKTGQWEELLGVSCSFLVALLLPFCTYICPMPTYTYSNPPLCRRADR